MKDKALTRAGLTKDELMKLIEERDLARKSKDFAKSDKMREDLTAMGISLMDVVGKQESVWRPCVPVEKEEKGAADSIPNPSDAK